MLFVLFLNARNSGSENSSKIVSKFNLQIVVEWNMVWHKMNYIKIMIVSWVQVFCLTTDFLTEKIPRMEWRQEKKIFILYILKFMEYLKELSLKTAFLLHPEIPRIKICLYNYYRLELRSWNNKLKLWILL